jgi:hypothetical protein
MTTSRWKKALPDEQVSGFQRKISTVFLQGHIITVVYVQ